MSACRKNKHVSKRKKAAKTAESVLRCKVGAGADITDSTALCVYVRVCISVFVTNLYAVYIEMILRSDYVKLFCTVILNIFLKFSNYIKLNR